MVFASTGLSQEIPTIANVIKRQAEIDDLKVPVKAKMGSKYKWPESFDMKVKELLKPA